MPELLETNSANEYYLQKFYNADDINLLTNEGNEFLISEVLKKRLEKIYLESH